MAPFLCSAEATYCQLARGVARATDFHRTFPAHHLAHVQLRALTGVGKVAASKGRAARAAGHLADLEGLLYDDAFVHDVMAAHSGRFPHAHLA